MRKPYFLFLIFAIFKIALIYPSYGSQFKEEEFANCIQRNLPLGSNNLKKSYDLCYEHFSDKYDQLKTLIQPTVKDELKKCTYALALSEILLKPLSKQEYGVNGMRFQTIIGYLKEYLNVMDDYLELSLSEACDSKLHSCKRYATIYKTMLAIKLEKIFPDSVTPEEFANMYELLSNIQSQKYTATIPLYMAHLIVFHDVRPDGILKKEALDLASTLVLSTYCETKNTVTSYLEKLHNELEKKQKDQLVTAPNSLYTKPALTTREEKEHREEIQKQIEKLQGTHQQDMEVEENTINLVQPRNKRKAKLVISDDDDETEEVLQQNMLVEENIIKSGQLSRKRKLVIDDEDETPDEQRIQLDLLPQSLPSEVSEANVMDALNGKPASMDSQKKRKLNNSHGEYNSQNVKAHILSQWDKGEDPDNDNIMDALGYKSNDTRRSITICRCNLKTKFPGRAPQKKLTSTQQIMTFLQQTNNAWEDLSTLYPAFNQLYPDLLTEKYFRDHGGLVRKFLALKGQIDDSTRRRNSDKFNVVVKFIDNNHSGNFEQFQQINPTVKSKYFYPLKGIYNDYTELFGNITKDTQ